MLNNNVEITIMRCKIAAAVANFNVTNTNSSITEISCKRPTAYIKLLNMNSFDNMRDMINNIITDTAMI